MRWLLLIALLLGGCTTWPSPSYSYVTPRGAYPGLKLVRLANCCGSMRPGIQGGEMAWVEPYTGQPLTLGDVVATATAMHMVVAQTKTHVKTTGTANRHSDAWSPKSEIKWVLRYVVRQ